MKRGRAKSAPSYRLHKASGLAVVTINGKDVYLGRYGSAESKLSYKNALNELWCPTQNQTANSPPRKLEPITVGRLAIEFGKYASRKFGEDSSEWKQIQIVLREIRKEYADWLAADFGPLRFEGYRQMLMDRGITRGTIKRKSNYVLKMFQLGVKYELIPVEFWQRLLAVGPVEMKTKPVKKRWLIELEIIRATQEQLTPVVADMVEVHRLIGARPSEICDLRPCDINFSDKVWLYTPAQHKTEYLGNSRQIAIGPKAQEVLDRYLSRDSYAYCFTPSDAYQQYLKRRSDGRKTPERKTQKSRSKNQSFKPNYNKDSYRRAIDRATARAFPIPEEFQNNSEKVAVWKERYYWKPNQLRKNAATFARKHMDLETAQLVLGHSSKKTTERFYAELDIDRALEFALRYG
ncbi:site-specific integrase [bacterium]|nr:site-specific integrase [bacterium]